MDNLNLALRHLRAADPVLAKLIDRFGKLNYQPPQDRFANLVETVIGQQLSAKAADTIFSRFLNLLPQRMVTPQAILDLPPDQIRSAGTSWAKIRSLQDLSRRVLAGSLDLAGLDSLSDEEVISRLTQVTGIGRWTAEMKLMFTLHRPDILPLTDVGIHNAFVLNYGLNRSHKSFLQRMSKLTQPWRPYRTVACWYLWKSLDNK